MKTSTKILKNMGVILIGALLSVALVITALIPVKTANAASYDYPTKSVNSNGLYVPGLPNANNPKQGGGMFPDYGDWKIGSYGGIEPFLFGLNFDGSLRGGAAVIDLNNLENQNLDLTKFDVAYSSNGGFNGAQTEWTENRMYYQNWSQQSTANNYWVYFYGYAKLPQVLIDNGGTLTLNATVGAFYDQDRPDKYFLSMVAGKNIYQDKTTKLNITDMNQNTSSGVTNIDPLDPGKVGKEPPTNNGGDYTLHNRDNQELNIKIVPGEQFVRISFVHFVQKNSGKAHYGQELSNVQLSWTPQVENVVGNNDESTFGGKFVNFNVNHIDNLNNVQLVGDTKGAELQNKGNGQYSLKVTKNGTYQIKVSNNFNNFVTNEIQVTNCYQGIINDITKGPGVVAITDKNNNGKVEWGEEVTVKVTTEEVANKIAIPQSNEVFDVVRTNYNYGVEAEYVIKFKDTVDPNLQTITATSEVLNVPVTIDGQVNEIPYGSAKQFTASGLGKFVGWYNASGVLVSTNQTIEVVATSAISLRSKFISEFPIEITYTNLAGKVIDVKGYTLGENVGVDDTIENILLNEKEITAPVNLFMEFSKWAIVSNQDGKVVVKSVYTRTNDTFNVTINGELAQKGYNEKVVLKGSEITTGWEVNGIVVTTDKDYEFYVTADVTVNELKSEPNVSFKPVVTTKTSTDNFVVSAIFYKNYNYKKVGFVIADSSINDNLINIKNPSTSVITVYSITASKQIVINLDSSYSGLKVRAYYVDQENNIHYGDVITLN